MNDTLSAFLFLSVPGLPLLLAFPALRAHLPWPGYFALLPAVVLLAIPALVSVDLPWLLFGTTLGFDGASRWLLGMSVLLWLVAAVLLQPPKNPAGNDRIISFYLLTLGGSLGVILAMDLLVFFVFSTLAGYGFYGLVVSAGGNAVRRAGGGYLVLLILADLALFEAILVAATITEDLGYESVRQAMAQSDSLGLYLLMVLLGFALKAGIWPLHFWLQRMFRSSQPAMALLLPGVPVALAMLGSLRWLPLGEIDAPQSGLILQGMGVLAMLYAILSGVKKAKLKNLAFHLTILATGLFTTAIGTGLADSAVWNRFGGWAYYCIVLFGLAMAVLAATIGRREARRLLHSTPAEQDDDSSLWFERWCGIVVVSAGKTAFHTLPRWRSWWLARLDRLWLVIGGWQNVLDASERRLQRWVVAITLFLLLGITLAFIPLG